MFIRFIRKNLIWYVIWGAIVLFVLFGWQGLELLFYGEIQHRIVDDIIAFILLSSFLINVAFVKAIYISKSDCEKYIILNRDEYNNSQQRQSKEYYWVLKTLEGNLEIADLIISNTIKNENGEETSTIKFDNVKSFAQNMKCFNDLNIRYIKKQLGEDDDKKM